MLHFLLCWDIIQKDYDGDFDIMGQQYLTVKQFAERAGVSTQRVYQLLTKSLQEFTKTEHGKKYISIAGLKVFERDTLQEVASPETEILRETVEVLRRQLAIKDEQLAAKDKQIGDLTAALLSSQEQHKALTDALTTAQALHAGTIQERLTAQVDSSEGQTDAMTADSDLDGGEPVQERQGFFARIFRKKGI